MSNIVLLGLPGLYQNWLMAAVDPNSKVQFHGDQNFFCAQSRVKWMIKPGLQEYPVASNQLTVINLCVNEQNFPWYLYNLFEKTYDIKIMVDSFVDDLLSKGDKFILFEEFKTLISTIDYTDLNAVVKFFYELFYEKTHYLYGVCQAADADYINIEFDDFNQLSILTMKLSMVPGFDPIHCETMYKSLFARNQRYLNRKNEFLGKLENNVPLDVIELGYVGSLAAQIFDKKIDWGNLTVRESIMKYKIKEIRDLAKALC